MLKQLIISFLNKNVSSFKGYIFVFLFLPPWAFSQLVVTPLMGNAFDLQINQNKSQEVVGRFVIYNPSVNPIIVYVSLRNSCNIRHFTRGEIQLPIDKVALRINNTEIVEIYDRLVVGGDCSSALIWKPEAPIAEAYTVDILIDWKGTGKNMSLAGRYQEGINLVAIEAP